MTNDEKDTSRKTNYYDKGCVEPMKETAVTMKRLEMRRKLTSDSHRLVLVLVGLPGRGKSFLARKLFSFFLWRGCFCKVFNVGKYRRAAVNSISGNAPQSVDGKRKAPACDANFFDANNQAAAKIRHECAALAMKDMLKWLDDDDHADQSSSVSNLGSDNKNFVVTELDTEKTNDDMNPKKKRRPSSSSSSSSESNSSRFVPLNDRIAIFDATNSTKARRSWIVDQLTAHTKQVGDPIGIVFVESFCDDKELLEENFRYKVSNSPDFEGISLEEGIADLRNRVKKYEESYETITDDSQSYIKLFNLSSKLLANQIYGRMSKVVVPALMAWNIGTRPIWICRAGETRDESQRKKISNRGDGLGKGGRIFRDALYAYLDELGKKIQK